MTKGKCTDLKCTFMHVKGTRKRNTVDNQQSANDRNQISTSVPPTNAQDTGMLTKEHFLEMVHLLRKELKEVVMSTTHIPPQQSQLQAHQMPITYQGQQLLRSQPLDLIQLPQPQHPSSHQQAQIPAALQQWLYKPPQQQSTAQLQAQVALH